MLLMSPPASNFFVTIPAGYHSDLALFTRSVRFALRKNLGGPLSPSPWRRLPKSSKSRDSGKCIALNPRAADSKQGVRLDWPRFGDAPLQLNSPGLIRRCRRVPVRSKGAAEQRREKR